MKKDILFTYVNQALNLLFGIFRTIIIAKYIDATEFGDFVIDLSIYIFIETIISSGFTIKLLQQDNVSKKFISSSFKQMLIILICSIFVVLFTRDLSLSSTHFLILMLINTPLSNISRGYILKEKQQHTETIAIIISQLFLIILVILYPLDNYGLLLQYLFTFIPISLPYLIIFIFRIPNWYYSLDNFNNKNKGLDVNLSIFGVAAQLSKLVDKWIIALVFPIADLGNYSKIIELTNLINSKIKGPLESVSINLLMSKKDSIILQYVSTLILITSTVLVLFIFGYQYIYIYFDHGWNLNNELFFLILFYTSITAFFSARGLLFSVNKKNIAYKNWGLLNLLFISLIWSSAFFITLNDILVILCIYALIAGPITIYYSSKNLKQFKLIIRSIIATLPLLIFSISFKFFTTSEKALDINMILIIISYIYLIKLNLKKTLKFLKK